MSLSWNLPQPCIPLLYPTYYYYQWLCSLHNLSCQHPAFQLAPLTLSLRCHQFLSPIALDWKIMVHPFDHLSEFTLSYLTPLSSTQVKSNSPLDYIEPDQLNIVGENTHLCWLSHLKFMTGSQPQEGEAILLSFLLPFLSPFTLTVIHILLLCFQHLLSFLTFSCWCFIFQEENKCSQKSISTSSLQNSTSAYLSLFYLCFPLFSWMNSLCRANSSPLSTEPHSCLSTQGNPFTIILSTLHHHFFLLWCMIPISI